MADTKLILQVDNLDHKLISVESEVAVNETFDIVFEGLSETEVGSTAKIELHTLSRKELVWVLEARIGRIEEGVLGILDCTINTQNALDITRITSAKTILTLVLTDDYGNRTVYGSAQMRLHPGYGEGGEPLVEIERSVEKHDVDPEAHKELFQSLREEDTRILQEVDGKIEDSKNEEVEARNQAIGDAVNKAKDEMANSYKGDLTDFARAAATSARASASSANAASMAADKTVEKLGEAYEVVKTLNGKISQVDGKVEVVGRYAASAEGAAGRANASAERAVRAEENIGVYVTQVSGLAAGIKQDADRAADVVDTVTEAKTAVETAKRQVDGLAEEVGGYKQSASDSASAASQSESNAEGSANTAKGHADRAEEAAGRANNYVNVELPNKVAILDQSIDDKMSAVDAHLESAQTAILGNIDTKAQEVNTAIDGKVTEANDAKDDAVKAKGEAETAKGQAEGFAKDASTSASNASTSATNAKTSENNAKSSATQAENATALKVDQRINTADDSEYPLVVMADKDVYKFIAPRGATNTATCRYCCDGTAHFFGVYGSPSYLYEYDQNLKFVKRIAVDFGQKFYADYYEISRDFCTKIGDNYFIRSCSSPYTVEKIIKYGADGTKLAEVQVVREDKYGRVCRNERTNHLIVFSRYTDEVTADDGSVSTVTRMGYAIYDENLVKLGERRLDAKFDSYNNWLQHLNIVGNTTFISYAPTDATQNAIHILDENDDIVRLSFKNPSNKTFYIYGSGEFTSAEKTSTGRTDGVYYVPRMFYDIRNNSRGKHILHFVNGAKWVDIELYFTESRRFEIVPQWERYISTNNIPQSSYGALSVFFANGSGNNDGGASWTQNVANLSASGVVTKIYEAFNKTFFTEFAPDPFVSLANFPRVLSGNCRLADDTKATIRAYQLYPAGTYGQAGGAIMFTV